MTHQVNSIAESIQGELRKGIIKAIMVDKQVYETKDLKRVVEFKTSINIHYKEGVHIKIPKDDKQIEFWKDYDSITLMVEYKKGKEKKKIKIYYK